MPRVMFVSLFLFGLALKGSSESQGSIQLKRKNHLPSELSTSAVKSLASLTNLQNLHNCLDNLLVERVVGTPGHENVKKFIVKSMEDLLWNVELDEFNDETPFGPRKFENIIATYNPNAERFLVLACHYDSKYFKGEVFIGATDSAVPCAMMLNLAFVLQENLRSIQGKNDLSLKFVFFDGEEAFETWGPKDSIYGARHLANKWENDKTLEQIDVLVLLDLLGAPDPNFFSFFKDTENWYARFLFAEERLDRGGHLERYSYSSIANRAPIRYFNPHSISAYIEDDHIPFLIRGVPILHLIPSPFPDVWHTLQDDRSSIDMTTVENLNKIFRIFLAEYLHLNA